MGRRGKLTTALAVLLLGTAVAMLFRRPSPAPKAVEPTVSNQPVLRPWTEPVEPLAEESPAEPKDLAQAQPPRHPRALIRAPLEQDQSPPRLARVYPRPDDAFPTEPEADRTPPRPAEIRPGLRIHKVAEGDTLELLAERYLGSADRAMEIFALNRDVLTVPDALPIGDELKIPSREGPVKKDDAQLPERPLVPVRR